MIRFTSYKLHTPDDQTFLKLLDYRMPTSYTLHFKTYGQALLIVLKFDVPKS